MFTSAGVPLFPLHLLPKPDLESLPAGVGALHVKQMRSSPTGPTSTEWRNYHHVINANIMRLIEMEVFKRRGAGGGVSGGAGGASASFPRKDVLNFFANVLESWDYAGHLVAGDEKLLANPELNAETKYVVSLVFGTSDAVRGAGRVQNGEDMITTVQQFERLGTTAGTAFVESSLRAALEGAGLAVQQPSPPFSLPECVLKCLYHLVKHLKTKILSLDAGLGGGFALKKILRDMRLRSLELLERSERLGRMLAGPAICFSHNKNMLCCGYRATRGTIHHGLVLVLWEVLVNDEKHRDLFIRVFSPYRRVGGIFLKTELGECAA